MAKVALYVWIVTVAANVVLALLLFGREYYIRFGWLSASTVISVAVELGLLWWCHTNNHILYEPLRLFIFYCLFYLLNALIIFEA